MNHLSQNNPLLTAILAAILDFRHIGLSDKIYFAIFELVDPENPMLDILQAMYNVLG